MGLGSSVELFISMFIKLVQPKTPTIELLSPYYRALAGKAYYRLILETTNDA
jgi:hypothetical protein